MTKTNIDTLLQDFHDQLHIPLLDATIKASREGTPESLTAALKLLHLASVAMQGIIAVVESTESLSDDQDVLGEVSRMAQSLVTCMQDLDALAHDIAEEYVALESE
ncbi:hypothetical protein [Klebsiella variicola]|uniref:hypothetical protein n=1 Tax=Klebsiella variicola TaxID=244366 RepID=UPI0037532A03